MSGSHVNATEPSPSTGLELLVEMKGLSNTAVQETERSAVHGNSDYSKGIFLSQLVSLTSQGTSVLKEPGRRVSLGQMHEDLSAQRMWGELSCTWEQQAFSPVD